jgi:hypothetical protein
MSFEENIKTVSYIFLLGGLLLLLFTINIYNSNGLLGKLFGYISIILSIFLLLIPTFLSLNTSSTTNIILKLVDELSPFVLFLAVLVISCAIISLNFKKLSKRNLPDSYKSFASISVILVVVQSLYFMYSAVQIKKSIVDTSKLRLISIINLIVLFTSFISLKYMTTDGFV